MPLQPAIIVTSLQAEIDGIPFQYAVKVDTRGLIREVHSHFFNLPPAARQLTVGSTFREADDRIKNRGWLFQYELLLALAGELEQPTEQIALLAQDIQRQLKQDNQSWETLAIDSDRFDVVDWFKFGIKKGQAAGSDAAMERLATSLRTLLLATTAPSAQQLNLHNAVSFFGYYGGPVGHDFLILLVPFHRSNNRRMLLDALKGEQREENKQLLLKQLTLPDNDDWVSGALTGIKHYRDPDVLRAAMSLFSRLESLSEDARANLATLVGAFPPDAEIIALLHTIVRMRLRHSSGAAAQVLAKIPGQQKIMSEEVIPVFATTNKTEVEGAFPVLLALDEDHLPDGETIWNIFLSSLALGPNLNIAYSMPSLLGKVEVPDLAGKLLAALSHPALGVRRSALVIISCDQNSPKAKHRYLTITPEIVSKVFQLIGDSDNDVSKEAVQVASQVEAGDLPASVVPDLVQLYEKSETRFHLRLSILEAFDRLFKKIPYDAVVEPICLAALENKNYNVRLASVVVLRNSDDPAVAHRLEKMSNDPEHAVRLAVKGEQEKIMGMDADTFSRFITDDKFRQQLMEHMEKERKRHKLAKDSADKDTSFLSRLGKLFRGK